MTTIIDPLTAEEVRQALAECLPEELRLLRDVCDELLNATPPAAGCFVPGCTGPCEGEPDRAVAPEADTPIRCQILVGTSRWRCLGSGCGASGHVLGWRLVDDHGLTISIDDLPTHRHPYSPDQACLFDRKKAT